MIRIMEPGGRQKVMVGRGFTAPGDLFGKARRVYLIRRKLWPEAPDRPRQPSETRGPTDDAGRGHTIDTDQLNKLPQSPGVARPTRPKSDAVP
jgi:hypothetical protein